MLLLPPITPERARAITSAFPGAQVLVIGDAMIDKFIVGRVTRLSPEAPVPVVAFDHETHRIGGAANVAHNIVSLGGQATLVAVTGQDDGAATLARACREAGIAPSFVNDPTRPTTTKVRIITERKHQVARIDYESETDVAGDVEDRVILALQQFAAHASAIVISDYLKGSITSRIAQAAIAAAGARGVPVLVDPKIPHLDYYAGADLVTPNHHEAEVATHLRIRSDDDARAAAHLFRERARCRAVLMTRGDQGMWLLGADAEGALPSVAREVADVTGAGDTVIATMALALACGATLTEAARLANEAAGISVSKFGPAVLTESELLASFR
ncbi:MAG: D-glycero-beta-D-manno-heptose-7-phosphate kinase [Acidobacteria bacterium]|nr:D-glycero-beta-D-manno-heptose-7-phosphate kinase [Acidobacteriota bacterium]